MQKNNQKTSKNTLLRLLEPSPSSSQLIALRLPTLQVKVAGLRVPDLQESLETDGV